MKEKEKVSTKAALSSKKQDSETGSRRTDHQQSGSAAATKRNNKTALKQHGKQTVTSQAQPLEPQALDMEALNLGPNTNNDIATDTELGKMPVVKDKHKIMEEVRQTISGSTDGRQNLSIVVIGHVDAGKSTLMGRLLYELGRINDKQRRANERGAEKMGKASFSWAWELDGTTEERERGVTMDIALQNFNTPHRRITVLDAPGHKDFIPNMISGAAQADCALLVVDASVGNFESGFSGGGQTREHLVLVRSLGVMQVVIAVNKLDQVSWAKQRYDEIVQQLQAYLLQIGFQSSRCYFVPIGAISGVNLVEIPTDCPLRNWYSGESLSDMLDKLEPPSRPIESPLRIPISAVFRGQTSLASGIGVSGRVISGIVQAGEHLNISPGNEFAFVRLIEVEEESVPWAAAGTNGTFYLSGVDPIHLSVGCILCPQHAPVSMVTTFVAQIIVFDITIPLIPGASVELFHHSRNFPAALSKLVSIIDRGTGVVVKASPRMLTKGVSAQVEISVRGTSLSGPATASTAIPLEPFKINKDMGRVLLRRNGETVAAGIVITILG